MMLEWMIAGGYVAMAWMLVHLPRICVTRRISGDGGGPNVPGILPAAVVLLGINVPLDLHHLAYHWWRTLDGGQVRDAARTEIAWVGLIILAAVAIIAVIGIARWRLRCWILAGLGLALAMELARGILLIGGREHPYEAVLSVIEAAALLFAMFAGPVIRRAWAVPAGRLWPLMD